MFQVCFKYVKTSLKQLIQLIYFGSIRLAPNRRKGFSSRLRAGSQRGGAPWRALHVARRRPSVFGHARQGCFKDAISR